MEHMIISMILDEFTINAGLNINIESLPAGLIYATSKTKDVLLVWKRI